MTQILELNQQEINHVAGGTFGTSLAGLIGATSGFLITTVWTFKKTESIKILLWTMRPSLKKRIIGSTIAGLVSTQYTHRLAKTIFGLGSTISEIIDDFKCVAFRIEPNK